jgi:hypothetical protein
MIAHAAREDWEIKQYNIKNAFLNADLTDLPVSVVCELPEGFTKSGKCARLKKALYRLREALIL